MNCLLHLMLSLDINFNVSHVSSLKYQPSVSVVYFVVTSLLRDEIHKLLHTSFYGETFDLVLMNMLQTLTIDVAMLFC